MFNTGVRELSTKLYRLILTDDNIGKLVDVLSVRYSLVNTAKVRYSLVNTAKVSYSLVNTAKVRYSLVNAARGPEFQRYSIGFDCGKILVPGSWQRMRMLVLCW